MGYYTAYTISFKGDEKRIEALKKEILKTSGKLTGYSDAGVRELLENDCVFDKLYDLKAWIEEAAKEYPDVLVILTGDGDNTEDCWECRWKGEETEEIQVQFVWPEYKNKNLLTEEELKNNKN